MRVAIIGNGILGLQTAYRLLKSDSTVQIILIGPSTRPGCASLAAAAMFNSFCEVDRHTLSHPIERQRFLFNTSSNALWPDLLKEIERASGSSVEYGFGTFLINNQVSDQLEDENFDAVIDVLKEFKEPYETVSPSTIPHYKPGALQRAGRAIFLPREGWVNPIRLMEALQQILRLSGRVQFIDGLAQRLTMNKAKTAIEAVQLDKESASADQFVLCPGASATRVLQQSNLGIDVMRIFYGIGATLLLKTGENTLTHCLRTPNRGLACGVYAAPQGAGHTVLGASNLVGPEPVDHARLSSIYVLLKAAMEQIHSDYYRSELVRVNVGWRPISADTLPLIGKTSLANLLIATGTRRDGLHCSPVISEYLADVLLKGKSKHDLSLYHPERKKVRLYSRTQAIELSVQHTLNAAYQHDFIPAKNRMLDQLKSYYTQEFSKLHDQVGATEWGIPPELIEMYRYGHVD